LVQDVVGADQPLQIAGDPPRQVAFQTVVMDQQKLRQGAPVASRGAAKEIRFGVVRGHAWNPA